MLISKYDKFVQQSDQTKGRAIRDRRDIAIYGLASEIGSVAAAIKKRLIGEDDTKEWNAPTNEIVEELGDAIWYCFALAGVANHRKPVNILSHDISKLRREISKRNARATRIKKLIGLENREKFLDAALSFPKRTRVMKFHHYQALAFLTARTEKRVLVEVCVAVLYQLSAELFRHVLPKVERQLNRSIRDRPLNDVLGEIAWHLAALATIYGLNLSAVASKNMEKVSFRQDRDHPTALHDARFKENEQFPRRFEVAFVTTSKGRSQMYMNGRKLGDELTDNAYDEDGYRFHDVMHIANAAVLGWSPVLRRLMGKKRKSDPKVDEVEDGARAQIVEELVIKAIHSEGQRLAQAGPTSSKTPINLSTTPENISFGFLKFLQRLVLGLEVHKNRYWEWEDAMIAGFDIFDKLRSEEQGTVIVDLDSRSLKFIPEVYIRLAGRVAGLGSSMTEVSAMERKPTTSNKAKDLSPSLLVRSKKIAILRSLGFAEPSLVQLESLTLTERAPDEISIKATGTVRKAMWNRKIVTFRLTTSETPSTVHCTAIALSDEKRGT